MTDRDRRSVAGWLLLCAAFHFQHPHRLRALSAAGLGLVLAVVAASAAIRLGADVLQGTPLALVRGLHRAAASLEVIVVLWLGWLAWRVRGGKPGVFRAAMLAIGVSAFLSVIGIVAGQNPPAAAAVANLLGGLALTALFAWLLGMLKRQPARMGLTLAFAVGVLLAIQLLLGARLSLIDRVGMALPLHALLAMALAALLGWMGLARVRGRAGKAIFALALAVPLAGFTALHYDHSAAAALVHAALAALLLAAAAHAFGRGA